MPAPKIVAEYTGTDSAHLGNIPASDLTEEQMDALSDEQRTALLENAASPHAIYKLRGKDIKAEAKEMAAEMPAPVEERVDVPSARAVETAPDVAPRPVSSSAPKAEAKKS